MRYCHDRDRDGVNEPKYTTRAPIRQVLTGHALNSVDVGQHCSNCGTLLQEGIEVSVIAVQPASEVRWEVADVFCSDCRPERIGNPDIGRAEVLASAYLATTFRSDTQSAMCTLTHVIVREFSPPGSGTGRPG